MKYYSVSSIGLHVTIQQMFMVLNRLKAKFLKIFSQ